MKRFSILLVTSAAVQAAPGPEYIEAIRLLGPLPSEYVCAAFDAAAARSPGIAGDTRVVFHAVFMDNGRILEVLKLGELDYLDAARMSLSASNAAVTVNASLVPVDSLDGWRLQYYVNVNDTLSSEAGHAGRMAARSSGSQNVPRRGQTTILCQGVLRQGSPESLARPHQLQPVLLVVATGGNVAVPVDGPRGTATALP